MRGLIGKILSYFGASHELHIKRNVVTYGICVIIATVLWFLNALNKEYTTEITYPIKYTDFPKGKLFVSEPPKEMTLAIKAHGFALLRYSISTSFLPIVLNVNSLLDKKDQLEYTVNTSEIKDRISAQLNTDIHPRLRGHQRTGLHSRHAKSGVHGTDLFKKPLKRRDQNRVI